MSSLITSLDIGSSQIKGIVATQKKDGTLSVVTAFKHPSAGFKRGILVDVESATAALRELVLDLKRVSKHATENVWVNINSDHVWSRQSQGMVAVARADQEIQQDDLDRVVEAARAGKMQQNRMVLHNMVREYFVDGVGDIADPLGMSGNRLEANTLIVEVFGPHLSIVTKTLDRVGFGVGGVIFNPLASARTVLTKRQKDLGVLLIDFGSDTTSFVIYEEGKVLITKSIPLGSGYITNDIVAGFRIPFDVAEKLKVAYGFASSKEIGRKELVRLSEIDPKNTTEISKRFLAEIIEVRLEEILDLVNNELKTLGRNLQLPGGVVIVGGGVKLPGMTEFVRQELKLPAQVGFPNLSDIEITNPAHQELLDDPEFVTAVGLLMWGNADERKVPNNFLEIVHQVLKNLFP
ncbi:MAG: cell division protein FtsA [Candidatus Paceibacterota bacterium]|jgi:cell division protein FtsA